MGAVVKIPSKVTEPGIVRLYSGTMFNLLKPEQDKILIEDIGWALSKQIRYNGHIPYDYSVARHSIMLSYYVAPEFALEALLHDSGEAFVGDMVTPLKLLCPQFEQIEDAISGQIFLKFANGRQVTVCPSRHVAEYHKSPEVALADFEIYEHECYLMGRPGRKIMAMYAATRQAEDECGLGRLSVTGNAGDYEAFMTRFYMLYEG